MEEKIAQGTQKLLKDFKTNNHKDLEEVFDIDVTILQHVEAILNNKHNALNILKSRMPYLKNTGEDIYKMVDTWQDDIKLAVLLHDSSELPSYKDADGDEDPDEKPLFDVLAKYFGEGFKDYINKDVISIVTSHHLDVNDKDKIEEFFNKYEKEFCLKFIYFMIVHDYGTLSLLSEFKTKKKYSNPDGNEKEFNYDLANIALNLKYNKVFNVIENSFYKQAQDNGKDFTTKIIAISQIHNNECGMAETLTSGDVGGGQHGAGDARHTNLFKSPIRRAWAIYNKRMKENDPERKGDDKMRKKANTPASYVVNPTTFSKGMF